MESRTLIIAAVAGILAVSGLIFGFPALQGLFINSEAAQDDTSDSGFAADISFRPVGEKQNPLSFLNNYPSASVLGGGFSLLGSPQFSVTNTAGEDVLNMEMVVGLKGKIIPSADVPVKSWSVIGTLKVYADGKLYNSYPMAKSGTGAPPTPIQIAINNGNEIAIPVESLRDTWGTTNYGTRIVSLTVDGTMKITFDDAPENDPNVKPTEKSKQFSGALVGSTTFIHTSEATATFEVESNYGTSGTTTETPTPDSGTTEPTIQTVTDSWGSLATDTGAITSSVSQGQKITDPNRFNVEITEIHLALSKYTTTPSGTLSVEIRSVSTGQLTATSIESYDAATILTTDKQKLHKFTFADGTETPSGEFYILVVSSNGPSSNTMWLSQDKNDPFTGGLSAKISSGTYSTNSVLDAVGKAVYKIPQ